MFVERIESGRNIKLKAMKYKSNVVLRGFMLGEAPMRHMKLPLVKCGSLLRGEVGWVRAGLCGVWT